MQNAIVTTAKDVVTTQHDVVTTQQHVVTTPETLAGAIGFSLSPGLLSECPVVAGVVKRYHTRPDSIAAPIT